MPQEGTYRKEECLYRKGQAISRAMKNLSCNGANSSHIPMRACPLLTVSQDTVTHCLTVRKKKQKKLSSKANSGKNKNHKK